MLLLPQAAGYASWNQIAAAWDDAWTKYEIVAQRQAAIREGQAAAVQGLSALVSLIPYLEASPTAELQADLARGRRPERRARPEARAADRTRSRRTRELRRHWPRPPLGSRAFRGS